MIKNQEYGKQVYEMIETAIEASWEMKKCLELKNYNDYVEMKNDLTVFLQYIAVAADELETELYGYQFVKAVKSVIWSVENLGNILEQYDNLKFLHSKIEFEIVPLLEEVRMNYYYWGLVYPEESNIKKFKETECYELCFNRYVEAAEETGEYKYEVSIAIIGYNKLDYTRECVKYLKQNLPQELSYELILINHGSTDGTKEFFEEMKPDKQLDIAYNGGGVGAVWRIVEGKYFISISNDVLVLENAIANMLACIKSDESIAWVVPSTSNVSNYQMLEIAYSSPEEMIEAAKKNNVLNPRRWEQRVRLCNPLDIKRTVIMRRETTKELFAAGGTLAFPDDRLSLVLRRKGYKMVLAKDAYCHHFGSVTIKDEIKQRNEQKFYLEQRRRFLDTYGVDPWGKGLCFSRELFANINIPEREEDKEIRILGIDCGLGSNPLKYKERYKELFGEKRTTIINITSQNNYLEDLKGVSDETYLVNDFPEWIQNDDHRYDFIVIECDEYANMDVMKMISELYDKVKAGGVLCLSSNSQPTINSILEHYNDNCYDIIEATREIHWIIIHR